MNLANGFPGMIRPDTPGREPPKLTIRLVKLVWVISNDLVTATGGADFSTGTDPQDYCWVPPTGASPPWSDITGASRYLQCTLNINPTNSYQPQVDDTELPEPQVDSLVAAAAAFGPPIVYLETFSDAATILITPNQPPRFGPKA
jgi:hypothetical protein